MKILALADVESKYLWDYFDKEKIEDVDLIISCGDLKPQYLSFLASFTKAPVIYVRGNHDDCYDRTPPDGCICIEDKIYEFNGIKILGLGGSIRYKNGNNQYTEKQMRQRVKKLRFKLLMAGRIDIVVTHSPGAGMCDYEDHAHKGFEIFNVLIEKYHPKYFLHGHVHKDYGSFERQKHVGNTDVINCYERFVIDYENN